MPNETNPPTLSADAAFRLGKNLISVLKPGKGEEHISQRIASEEFRAKLSEALQFFVMDAKSYGDRNKFKLLHAKTEKIARRFSDTSLKDLSTEYERLCAPKRENESEDAFHARSYVKLRLQHAAHSATRRSRARRSTHAQADRAIAALARMAEEACDIEKELHIPRGVQPFVALHNLAFLLSKIAEFSGADRSVPGKGTVEREAVRHPTFKFMRETLKFTAGEFAPRFSEALGAKGLESVNFLSERPSSTLRECLFKAEGRNSRLHAQTADPSHIINSR